MAVTPQWQFEYKITIGNVLMLVSMLGAATLGYSDLKWQVNNLFKQTEVIPIIEDRMTAMEQRGAQARTERAEMSKQSEALQAKVDRQEEKLSLILQTVARIDERIQFIARGSNG